MAMLYNPAAVRSNLDLFQLITDSGVHLKKHGTGEYKGACPFCGGSDRFSYQAATAGTPERWFCRGCGNGKFHDAIDFIMHRDGVDFQAACKAAGVNPENVRRPEWRKAEPPAPKPVQAPPDVSWQELAWVAIYEASKLFWSSTADKARRFLYQSRGLHHHTINEYYLGYSTGDMHIAGTWTDADGADHPEGIHLERGFVIPGIGPEGRVWYLKIRRPHYTDVYTPDQLARLSVADKRHLDEKWGPKYRCVKGSKPAAMFGSHISTGATRRLVLIEGEYNAMIGYQNAGGYADFLSLGAAGYHLDLAAWGRVLLPYKDIRAVYDTDSAGNKGAAALLETLPHIRRAAVPVQDGVKDLCDYHRAGGDVAAWTASIFQAVPVLETA